MSKLLYLSKSTYHLFCHQQLRLSSVVAQEEMLMMREHGVAAEEVVMNDDVAGCEGDSLHLCTSTPP
jgi:hypothetical protein